CLELFQSFVGKPRNEYDGRVLEAAMGDYRLGRCVEACLLTRYSFVQPQIGDLLAPEHIASLASLGIATPSYLRLYMWSKVNSDHGGFVTAAERAQIYAGLLADWGLPGPASIVDSLMNLDNELAAVLTPTGDTPTPAEIASLYNRGVVTTLLAHSADVRFDVSHLPGAALKRLYFVAKRNGVFVDIEEGGAGYLLTLYGPEQAAGTADKYGRRLATVSLSLLRHLISEGYEEVSGTARLVLHERPYCFHITAEVLSRLDYSPAPGAAGKVAEGPAAYTVGSVVEISSEPGIDPLFDSMVEAGFYHEFSSLQRGGYTHGWRIEREPEPMLAPGLVLIPDFAFSRDGKRVYMEVAGFWSPSYKERKLAKLRLLAAESSDAALILAVPREATAHFTGLPFPAIEYKLRPRATDVLATLDRHYGEQEGRQEAAQSKVTLLREQAHDEGLVSEGNVAQAMQAYTRSELLASASLLSGEGCRYVPGVGLLSEEAIATVYASLETALAGSGNRIDLEEASSTAAAALSSQTLDIEALAQLWPQWRIERPSLFEAYLTLRVN
ncbi:MAG: DUF790 family protein, partial [Chloroflexota bacterium]|nr:DUF790 family protein [Chloroflexota bacterium]